MNKAVSKTLSAFLLICILLSSLGGTAAAVGAGTVLHNSVYEFSDTLRYTDSVSSSSAGRQESYIIEYIPGQDVTAAVASGSAVLGSRNIFTAASSLEKQGYNVLAGINASFFSTSTGISLGLIVENGRIRSGGGVYNAVAFNADGSAFICRPTIYYSLINNTSGQTVAAQLYNQVRDKWGLYLLGSDFAATNLATVWGKDVLMRIIDGEVTVSGEVTLQVEAIYEGNTPTKIPEGYILLTGNTESYNYAELNKFAVGDMITLKTSCSDPRVSQAVFVASGGDVLISNGQIADSSGWDSALTSRNPRTALGIKSDGTVVLYAIDGRNASHSNGLTMIELAEQLLALGCVSAINLDGGGSTSVLMRRPGTSGLENINVPSDGSLRKCSSFIFLLSSNVSDGLAAKLWLSPNDPVVLAGSTITFDGVTATDSALRPAQVPGTPALTALLGSVSSGLTYTAPAESCTDTVFVSAGDVTGNVTVTVADKLDSFYLTKKGSATALTSLSAAPGSVIPLDVAVSALGGTPLYSKDVFSYSVSGEIGAVSSDGVFTATDSYGGASGSVTVSFAGQQATVAVTVEKTQLFDDVGPSHWAFDYVNQLALAGVAEGTQSDGKKLFSPDSHITREAFCTLMSRYLKLDTSAYRDTDAVFADEAMISDWALEHIKALYDLGYVDGTGSAPDGSVYFSPSNKITRQQVFTIIGRTLDVELQDTVELLFKDTAQISSWAVEPIEKLVYANLLSGYDDGTLRPSASSTRAEAAKILCGLR